MKRVRTLRLRGEAGYSIIEMLTVMGIMSIVFAGIPALIYLAAGLPATSGGMTIGTLFTLFVVPVVYLLIGRVMRQRLPVSTYAASVYGTAAAVLLPACLLTGSSLGGYAAGSWLAVAGVVIGPQLLGHTVFNSLLTSVSATVVSVVLLIEPVGATALAWLLFHELPAAGFWVGAPLVLAGSWLAIIGEQAGAGPEAAPAA